MAGRLWKREQHTRRLVRYRLHHHLQPRFGYGTHPLVRAAWPQRQWHPLGFFEDLGEAQRTVAQYPGAIINPVHRFRGKRLPSVLVVGYRVGYVTRLRAPFRTPVMTWTLEEAQQAYEADQVRRWLKRGSLKGGVARSTRVSRRRWRRAGQYACRLALRGELDAVADLDPQPQRLGVMWLLW